MPKGKPGQWSPRAIPVKPTPAAKPPPVARPPGKWRTILHAKNPEDREDHVHETHAGANAAFASKKARAKPGQIVTQHQCAHAAGEPREQWYNCKTDPRAQYQQYIKP